MFKLQDKTEMIVIRVAVTMMANRGNDEITQILFHVLLCFLIKYVWTHEATGVWSLTICKIICFSDGCQSQLCRQDKERRWHVIACKFVHPWANTVSKHRLLQPLTAAFLPLGVSQPKDIAWGLLWSSMGSC